RSERATRARRIPACPRKRPALHLRFVGVMMLALHLGADLPDESRILGFCFLPLRHRRPALERAEVIDEKLAVEVVDLVLEAASEELGPGCLVLGAVLVGGADGNRLRTLDIAIDVGYRETALFRFFI